MEADAPPPPSFGVWSDREEARERAIDGRWRLVRRGCAKSGLDSLARSLARVGHVGVACESCFAGNVLTKVFQERKE